MNYGISQKDILALSPYQAQCKLIEKKLQDNRLSSVKSSTVKSSEGMFVVLMKLKCHLHGIYMQ